MINQWMAPPTPDQLLAPAVQELADEGEVTPAFLLGFDGARAVVPCMDMSPQTLLSVLPVLVRAQDERLLWACYAADTYVWTGQADDEELNRIAGTLGERFQAGDPKVGEALSGLCICPDGPTYGVDAPYVRGPVIDWLPRRVRWGRQSGAIPDGMYALFQR